MFQPSARRHAIGDYALIGNSRTAALVSNHGSIDWLCLPRFDSPSVFAALLDPKAGHFSIRPSRTFAAERRYVPDTTVLETTFTTATGRVVLRDALSVEGDRLSPAPEHEVLREIHAVEGEVDLDIEFAPRMEYGAQVPVLEDRGNLGIRSRVQRGLMTLRADMRLTVGDGCATGHLQLRAGERRYLSLSFDRDAPAVIVQLGEAAGARLDETVRWWSAWAAQCTYDGPYRDEVVRSALTLKLLAYAPSGEVADTVPPAVSREFRAVWVATVDNIDWPSRPGLPTEAQQAELIAILERARQLHLNAIIFQVRPAADALYPSTLEPWSYFLTGAMGRPPAPMYDPLAFAIEEAHRRGLELHAWFNPYRARHPGDKSQPTASHVSRAKPKLVKRYGSFLWMDPGEPEVRRQTTRVILDVVRRYDVDGVHIDDYFYPYPERARRGGLVPFPDDASWRAYRARQGTLSRDDWRRRNVDLLVEELYDGIKKIKPWVKFGISPFGIWRPGFPAMVRGLDPYEQLYADSRKWLLEGWLDYFTPQLYWRTDAPMQPYAELLKWWRAQNPLGRHVWPGNYTSRASSRGRQTWPAAQVIEQIRLTRDQLASRSGNVHFSMDAFMVNRDSLDQRLLSGPYAEPAIVPSVPWLAAGIPDSPIARLSPSPDGVEIALVPGASAVAGVPRSDAVSRAASAARATPAPADRTRASAATTSIREAREPRWWLVRARYLDGWRALLLDASERTIRLGRDANGAAPDVVTVTAVDHAGIESPPAFAR